ncbi:mevalonate kinase [Patescibacteria group bacterium]|nr:mevalonate kinase [Patescibacteria group bacterium]
MSKNKVSAPGKIILSGEHAVVYGYPGLYAATSLRMDIKLTKNPNGSNLSSYANYAFNKALRMFKVGGKSNYSHEIKSRIPVGSGMGSSASLAVCMSALAQKLAKKEFNLEEINRVAYEIEKKQHGKPSGGDNTIVTFGGFVWYRKEAENLKVFSKINPKKTLPNLFIINSGTPKESTGEMVSLVREKYEKNPKKVKNIFNQIEFCSKGFLKFILDEEKDEEKNDLGDLITLNERLLEELEVVSPETKNLISLLEKNKASVKISGAGGKSQGSGILLVYHKNPEKLKNFVKSEKLDMIPVSLGKKGVKIDK